MEPRYTRRTFADGGLITAMRLNAGLTVEQLADAVGYSAIFLRLMEAKRGMVSGPMPRKIMRHLVSLKAHERLSIVSISGRPTPHSTPIAWDFTCGATTNAGTPCKQKATYQSGRCKLHGGLSTGPRTPAGKDRVREGQRVRRERERAAALLK